ncbi:MAG: type VI secretion system baseplate subunit TssK [Smithella sp.]
MTSQKMNEILARIDWKMGQALLPEHLIAQEESLLADSNFKFRMLGMPFYGIGSLKIIESLLAEGIFSVQEIAAVMVSGKVLVYPGNISVAPFNLNMTGTTKVALYFHLLNTPVDSSSGAIGKTESAADIPRKFYKTVFSTDQDFPDVVESLKIAEFIKSPDGIWQFSRNYVPPLLQVGTSPFFIQEIKTLSESLTNFQYSLYMDSMSYLSGDSLTTVKQCLKRVYIVQRLLANILADVHLHPFFLQEELLNLYAEVCFYREMAPENITEAYRHGNPVAIYKIIDILEKLFQMAKSLPPYIPFALTDNIYKVTLTEEVRKASSVYFLVQKDQVMRNIALSEVKLAGLSRLSAVHKMALKGIPLKRVEHPQFRHAFGSEVEFYLISEGEEWDYALSEMCAAFYNRPELADINFYIFWRIE